MPNAHQVRIVISRCLHEFFNGIAQDRRNIVPLLSVDFLLKISSLVRAESETLLTFLGRHSADASLNGHRLDILEDSAVWTLAQTIFARCVERVVGGAVHRTVTINIIR